MNKIKIGIVDYNLGNLKSVGNALNYLGYSYFVTNDIHKLKSVDVILFPGVGAFDVAMRNLKNNDLDLKIKELVISDQKIIMGICLGMQLLATSSDENGFTYGLDLIPGHVEKLITTGNYKVPHVGWNEIKFEKESIFFDRKKFDGLNYYFDHSYHFIPAHNEDVLCTTIYENKIVSGVNNKNVFGFQFHPEKSQVSGLKLFRSFITQVVNTL
jgi:glutamine amidotransferase